MEDVPLTLAPEQVGALALAIPSIVLIVVQMLKAAFYRLAPFRWQVALPDRPVWMGLAFVLCVGTSVVLKMDIPQHVFGDDWPDTFPWWVSAAASGVMLGVVQAKVLYPLAVKPQVKRKAAEAVLAACGPPPDDTHTDASHWTEGDPGDATRGASPPGDASSPLETPQNVPESHAAATQASTGMVGPPEPSATSQGSYTARLLTDWPVEVPTRPTHLLLRRLDGTLRVVELTRPGPLV